MLNCICQKSGLTRTHEKLRKRWHIPAERTFASKADLGLQMIRHAKANRMQFEVVGCDTTYGRDSEFRRTLDEEHWMKNTGY